MITTVNSPQPLAGREVLWNVSHPANSAAMYFVFALSLLVCGFGLVQRFRLWAGGRAEGQRSGNWLSRLRTLWHTVAEQRTVRKAKAARFHNYIFYGFLVLLFTTTMVFLDHDLGIPIYRGRFYLAVTVLSDLFGVLLLYGVGRAWHRRYIRRPDQLHSTAADGLALIILAFLVVQGYALEALRIAVTNDPWKYYSPVGFLLSKAFWPLSPQSARVLHFAVWWVHAITVFGTIAVLPYTKFLHILASSANLYFAERGWAKGALRYPGDMDAILEKAADTGDDSLLGIGISTIKDLSWKQRLDLDACTSCGRCQSVCPAYRTGTPLSPKWLILDTRDHMLQLHQRGLLDETGPIGSRALQPLETLDRTLLSRLLLRPRYSQNETPRAANESVQVSARRIGESPSDELGGEVLDENVFWSCTTCRACMEVCPVGIEHIDLISDVRRNLALLQGKIPGEAQPSLRAIETRGNPFGPPEQRLSWSDGLDLKILEPGQSVDVLYWVGCISAYDRRKQKIARAMVEILNRSGISWGMLGKRESCTGDPARRLGDENLFQSSAKKNIATLKDVKFKRLVANCPHCMNTFRNEYPQLGAEQWTVLHHSELLEELIRTGRLKLREGSTDAITFHDPCYLGRHNGQYDAPREVLYAIGGRPKREPGAGTGSDPAGAASGFVPDAPGGSHDRPLEGAQGGPTGIVEMPTNRRTGTCCGAGGGHFWMDLKLGGRINADRAIEAAETGAKTIATACPFCLHMLEDGLKLTSRDEAIGVRDIAELVVEHLS